MVLYQSSCAQGYSNGRAHPVKGNYDKGDALLPGCHVARLKPEENRMKVDKSQIYGHSGSVLAN